ncbi:MAG: nicotinate-nucleotide adenylyltransferase [Acidimicrobiales bacterium]
MGNPRIGILGGTFDPVHSGHLTAAINVRYELDLDSVLLVVANQPWQKVGARPVTAAPDRLALVQAAVEAYDGLAASDLEIERGGISYTADTIAELARTYPGVELHLIIGADVAGQLGTWVRLEEVRRAVTLVVVNRPGTRKVQPGSGGPLAGWRVAMVEIPALEISSTDLRDRAAAGRPLDFLMPPESIRMLRRRNLYVDDR